MSVNAGRIASVGLLVLFQSCQPGLGHEAVTIRDSTGVRIVENYTPEWQPDDPNAWRVSTEPVLQIGEAFGNPTQELYSVSSVRRIANGSIAISSGNGAEVRLFDEHGRYLLTIGRRGSGPGEFTTAGRLFTGSKGTLSVWDHYNGRLSKFTQDGEFLSSVTIPGGTAMTGGVIAGTLDDGSVVYWLAARMRVWPEDGHYRASEPLLRYQPTTQTIDTLAVFAGREVYWLSVGEARYTHAVIFGRDSYGAARSNDVVWGNTDSFDVFVVEPDGDLSAIFRVQQKRVAVTQADERRARRALLDKAGEGADTRTRRRWEEASQRVPAHGDLPAFGKILVDDADNVWIEKSQLPWVQRQEWHVLDRRGRWLGDIRLPDDLTVHHIGNDFVIGTATDVWDAPVVRVYHLQKPARHVK